MVGRAGDFHLRSTPGYMLDMVNYLLEFGTRFHAGAQMADISFDRRIEAVRRFNRLYTRRIGVLPEGHLDSEYSLAASRVLYEVAHRDDLTAASMSRELGLDAGYLSRILRSLEKRRLIRREASAADAREAHVRITAAGRRAFAALDGRANAAIASLLGPLGTAGQRRLIEAARTIESILEPATQSRAPYLLRAHEPGDMGWVVHRHGVLYASEYGYDDRFEALVAQIVADFIRNLDTSCERCWIAEREGEIVGSVFLVRKSKTVAKLRLLLVEPSARGLGIGKRLVDECIRFARHAGYRRITLYTQKSLRAARGIYQQAGFRVVGEQKHRDFGPPSVAETWEIAL
jgi:DNA-binding MarR family transcriptional regulator/GNAT superfamily N-acetyltransferase